VVIPIPLISAYAPDHYPGIVDLPFEFPAKNIFDFKAIAIVTLLLSDNKNWIMLSLCSLCKFLFTAIPSTREQSL